MLAQHDALLDLHSFRTPGEPFALVGPENNSEALGPFAHAAREQALVLRLGVRRIVDGWLSTYAAGVEQRRARRLREGDAVADLHADYGVGTTESQVRHDVPVSVDDVQRLVRDERDPRAVGGEKACARSYRGAVSGDALPEEASCISRPAPCRDRRSVSPTATGTNPVKS